MKKCRKKKWIVAMVIIVALIATYLVTVFSGGVEADTIAAEKGFVRKLVKESGTVESDNSIIISSAFTGEVKGLAVSAGDLVSSGWLLLSGDKSVAQLDLKSLRAQLAGLEISYSRAKELAGRNKNLYDQGVISKEEYDSALASEKELEAQVSSLRYSIESYAKASATSGVTSPIKGTVTDVFVKEGEYVTVGAPLFAIADLDNLFLMANLIAEDADMVEAGDKVLIYTKNGGGIPIGGSSVRHIHLKAKEEVSGLGIIQKRVAVEIEMSPEISPRLGSDVDLGIIIEEKEDVIRVPLSSVFRIDGDSYVYVAEEGRAMLRQVEKGLEGDEHIEIAWGLAEGEVIILSPGNEIEDGTRLKR